MTTTVFERCGGFAKVRPIVSEFYDRILDSESLQAYFQGTDMRRLVDHQTKFVAQVMGGPASFSDDAVRRAHTGLGITRDDFMEVAELLRETLEDFDVDAADVDHVCREFARRAPLIVVEKASKAAA